jgi:hypothetical protein
MGDGEIGLTAGAVWRYLSQNGEVTTAKLVRELDAPSKLVDRAIGWLAREGKVELTMDGRFETVRLMTAI